MMTRDRNQAGFALVSVLLAVGLMAGFVAAYGTHVVMGEHGNLASTPLLSSREACQSALSVAHQGLLSGADDPAAQLTVGHADVSITVSDVADDQQLVDIQATTGGGVGSRRRALVALQPSAAAAPAAATDLPSLDSATVSALLSDDDLPRLHVTSSTRLEDVDLEGLLIVHAGAELQLAGVVLQGCVISAAVLSVDGVEAFDADTAPRLVLDGDVRLDSHPALDGVAILMPDGIVDGGASDARIQVSGDVVAHDVDLQLQGALDGHVSAVNSTLADAASLDRIGADRRPEAWTSPLDLGGTRQAVELAFVTPSTSLEALAPIIGFWNEG